MSLYEKTQQGVTECSTRSIKRQRRQNVNEQKSKKPKLDNDYSTDVIAPIKLRNIDFTKIYSGGANSGKLKEVSKLSRLADRVLQKRAEVLYCAKGAQLELLKPILERLPDQKLHVFEEHNPHLKEDTDGLWQPRVLRTFGNKNRLENESWRGMFIRCQEEQHERLLQLADSIKASQKSAPPPRQLKLAFVNSVVKPSPSMSRTQKKFGTQAKITVPTTALHVPSANTAKETEKIDATPPLRVPPLRIVISNGKMTVAPPAKETEKILGSEKNLIDATPAVRALPLGNANRIIKRDHKLRSVGAKSKEIKKAPLMQKVLKSFRNRFN